MFEDILSWCLFLGKEKSFLGGENKETPAFGVGWANKFKKSSFGSGWLKEKWLVEQEGSCFFSSLFL